MSTHGNRPSDRIGLQFRRKEGVNQGGLDEVNETDVWLAPLRQPANIRDMKQIFFYVSRTSTESDLALPAIPGINPNVVFPDEPFAGSNPFTGNGANSFSPIQTLWPSYGSFVGDGTLPLELLYNTYPAKVYRIQNPLGTQLPLNIIDMIQDNYDIRVSPDKYVIEISLVECQIDTSAGNYQQTFKQNEPYLPANDYQNQTDIRLNTIVPQGLYCRIKEVDNGEPYNWVVTNTGQYSNDRSHAVLIRFGDMNYSQLTLEYGHCSLEGFRASPEILKPASITTPSVGGPQVAPDPNTYGIPPSPAQIVGYPVAEQGAPVDAVLEDGVVQTSSFNVRLPQRFSKSQAIYYDYNRAWYMGKPNGPSTAPSYAGQVVRDDEPLFYNQQTSNITWRFMIRMIHLF